MFENGTFKDFLIAFRNSKGVTRENLAAKMGVKFSCVTKIEMKKNSPTLEYVEMFAESFGLKTFELLKIYANLELDENLSYEEISKKVNLYLRVLDRGE